MGPILPFIRPHDVLDTATLTLLGEAYDKAIASIHDDHGQPAVARQIIATHILDLPATGERNVDLLCQEALVALGGKLEANAGGSGGEARR